jgi:SAM-dependent methyltransferase
VSALPAQVRDEAFGQAGDLTFVDRFGVWLSARLVEHHATLDGKDVADFGCGYDASFARRILPRVNRMLLVDLQLADDLDRHHKVQARMGRIESVLPTIDSQSLDVVLCLSVLEHLSEPQQALAEFRRILAPGGVALLNVPSWFAKPWLELCAFRLGLGPALEMDDHKRYYDPRDLWPMLVRAGFRPSAISCRRRKFGMTTFAVCRVPSDGDEAR